MGGLTSGYITRADGVMPRQGRQGPWAVSNHDPNDKTMLLDASVDDGVLSFEKKQNIGA